MTTNASEATLTTADKLAFEEVMREVEHYQFDLFAASLDDQYRQQYEI